MFTFRHLLDWNPSLNRELTNCAIVIQAGERGEVLCMRESRDSRQQKAVQELPFGMLGAEWEAIKQLVLAGFPTTRTCISLMSMCRIGKRSQCCSHLHGLACNCVQQTALHWKLQVSNSPSFVYSINQPAP